MNQPKRGEVWRVDLGGPQDESHEQAGQRPAIIFQNDDLSRLTTVVIIPLTSQTKRAGFAGAVLISKGEGGLTLPSVALCHQIRALDGRRLIQKLGDLSAEKLSEVEAAILFVLGVPS